MNDDDPNDKHAATAGITISVLIGAALWVLLAISITQGWW